MDLCIDDSLSLSQLEDACSRESDHLSSPQTQILDQFDPIVCVLLFMSQFISIASFWPLLQPLHLDKCTAKPKRNDFCSNLKFHGSPFCSRHLYLDKNTHVSQCIALTRRFKKCGTPAVKGSPFCPNHDQSTTPAAPPVKKSTNSRPSCRQKKRSHYKKMMRWLKPNDPKDRANNQRTNFENEILTSQDDV